MPSSGSTSTASGYVPRATYPGRIRNSAARTYATSSTVTPGISATPGTTSTVQGIVPRGTANNPVNVRSNPAAVRSNPATAASSGRSRSTVARNGLGVNPTGTVATVQGYRPGVSGAGTSSTVSGVYTQPVTTINNNNFYNVSRANCAPRYNDCNDPFFYSNYNCRRGYRFYQPCFDPFFSLGFFVARPYAFYDYARIDYAQPFVYGDDAYYRSAPVVDNRVAAAQTSTPPQSMEQELLTELAGYVASRSVDGSFRIADPAFGGQLWKLDLTQAPAVYSIDSNHYSVVAGFEGTLGENTIPSSVGLEFFVARENGRWSIKDAWIVSANGIPRAKKFQSPVYPQVQTWQPGAVCPFSGQPMIPLDQGGRG